MMSKVTSKLQVTVPKAIAEKFRIKPGSHIEWVAAGEVIRVLPPGVEEELLDIDQRLRLFDQATERIKKNGLRLRKSESRGGRGWKREDRYRRGRSR